MITNIKRGLRTIFGIYALLVFLAVLIIVFILYIPIFAFVNSKRAPFIAHKYISRPWAASLLILFGVRLIIKNKEYLDKNETYVFIGNHSSQLDIPAYAVSTNHTIRFLAKAELGKLPLMGFIIKKLYIIVDRKDKAARARSMENMISSLKENISVFICPEGTRNKTSDPLLPFHDGAFRLAIQSQVPLAILVLRNADHLLSPLRPIELSPGKIYCIWCQPIPTKGMTQDDLPALKEAAIQLMLQNLA